MSPPLVCTIGATDPWNASGLGLDLRIFAQLEVYAVWVVAGVSAQDADGLHAFETLPVAAIEAQFDALAGAEIGAYRIGALRGASTVAAVARRLRGARVPVVYDPVLGPSAGGIFADAATRAEIADSLLACVTVVTPNVAEAQLLANVRVVGAASMEAAGRALLQRGARAALIKGSHLPGEFVRDVLVEADGTAIFESPRIGGEMRGTGCVLAAALSAFLARGLSLHEALERARAIVRDRLQTALALPGFSAAR